MFTRTHMQEKHDHKSLEFTMPIVPGTDGFSTLIAIFTPENLQYILKDNFSNYGMSTQSDRSSP